jgi:hypothetical protein
MGYHPPNPPNPPKKKKRKKKKKKLAALVTTLTLPLLATATLNISILNNYFIFEDSMLKMDIAQIF